MEEHHHHHSEICEHNKYLAAFAQHNLHLHDEQVAADVERLLHEKLSSYNRPEVLKELLRTIELTTLKVTDSDETVLKMVEKYNQYSEKHPELPPFASICVYPRFIEIVANSLEVEGTEVASVVGGFPSSQTFLEVKTIETSLAIHDGATECDMVLSVGAFLQEDYETCVDEIEEIKAACGEHALKVILETGALQTAENIKRAAILAMYAGADFIKTSTGKVSISATPEAAYVMCQAIKEYYDKTGRKVGFKASGGVSTPEDALKYYTIVQEVLGQEWIDDNLFRIGTSSLAPRLIKAVTGEDIGSF